MWQEMTPWCWSVRGDLCHGAATLVWATALFYILNQMLMAYRIPGWFIKVLYSLNLLSRAIDQVNAQNITMSKYLVSQIKVIKQCRVMVLSLCHRSRAYLALILAHWTHPCTQAGLYIIFVGWLAHGRVLLQPKWNTGTCFYLLCLQGIIKCLYLVKFGQEPKLYYLYCRLLQLTELSAIIYEWHRTVFHWSIW